MDKKNKKAVVERLKKSKEASNAISFAVGEEQGYNWAAKSAETIHLEHLAIFDPDMVLWCNDDYRGDDDDDDDDVYPDDEDHDESGYPLAVDFVNLMTAGEFVSRPDLISRAHKFWSPWYSERHADFPNFLPGKVYVQGFTTGAVKLWTEVKDQVRA